MLFRLIINLSCGGFGEYLEGLRQHLEQEIAALRKKLDAASPNQRPQLEADLERLKADLEAQTGGPSGGCASAVRSNLFAAASQRISTNAVG